MKLRSDIIILGALFVVACLLGIVFTKGAGQNVPGSTGSPQAMGVRAAYLYLAERSKALAHRGVLTELPRSKVVVLASPSHASTISNADADFLLERVKSGTRFIYMAHSAQLDRAFDLDTKKAAPPLFEAQQEATVDASKHLAVRGVSTLTFSNAGTLNEAAGWDAVATDDDKIYVQRAEFGEGEVWRFSNHSPLQNANIDLGDNAQVLENLAVDGTVVFLEHAGSTPEQAPFSPALALFLIQVTLCGLAFVWAFGSRLGPPRPERQERHRSSLEYVTSFAHLTAQAGVERELLDELESRWQALLQEHAAVGKDALPEIIARVLHAKGGIAIEEYVSFSRDLARVREESRITPRQFLGFAQRFARFERGLRGMRQSDS